jgi:hypothetical protein
VKVAVTQCFVLWNCKGESEVKHAYTYLQWRAQAKSGWMSLYY